MSRRTFVESVAAASVVAGVSSALAAESEQEDLGINQIFQTRVTKISDSGEEVSEDILQLLLLAAFSAPSGGNQHALDFFVVNDADKLEELKNAHRNYSVLGSATAAIVICGNANNVVFPELQTLDAGLAAMAICLEASDLGIAARPLSVYNQWDRMANVGFALNSPLENSPVFDPYIIIALGYPQEDAISSASIYNYDESKVHWNQYEESEEA